MKLKYIAMLLAAGSASGAMAEEHQKWEASSELGVIITSGNTETTTMKGAVNVKQNLENWNNEFKFDALYKEDKVTTDSGDKVSQRTSEKYFASAQGNYKLNEKHAHLFIYGSYLSDYFGAYRNESVISGGYGLRLINETDMKLNAEVGPGYKYYQYQDDSTELDDNGLPLAGEHDGEVIALAKADFTWQISDAAKFTQLVAMEYGGSNTKTRSESALLTKINGSLQMKVALNITHNSDVAADKENTDTETALTLVYNF